MGKAQGFATHKTRDEIEFLRGIAQGGWRGKLDKQLKIGLLRNYLGVLRVRKFDGVVDVDAIEAYAKGLVSELSGNVRRVKTAIKGA